jgi:RIO-like serine/threonine protein kinase
LKDKGYTLSIKDLKSNEVRKLQTIHNKLMEACYVSKDKKIAITNMEGENLDIYFMNLSEGSTIQRVTNIDEEKYSSNIGSYNAWKMELNNIW